MTIAFDEAAIAKRMGDAAVFHESNADIMEAVSQNRAANAAVIDRALDIVRNFIIERGLIVFGGLAIDFALRLKGRFLYPDSTRPDYDVCSTDNVRDAYDLGDILLKAGFTDISVIRAIHSQTMRVRINAVSVLDCGHVPADIFHQIDASALDLKGVKFVSPYFQRLDMHMAFCYPLNNPPREDVFNRWAKDFKRFNMLDESYPTAGLLDAIGVVPDGHVLESKTLNVALGRSLICSAGEESRFDALALCGFAGIVALRDACIAKYRIELAGIVAGELTIGGDGKTVGLTVPAKYAPAVGSIALVGPNPAAAFAENTNIVEYEPYLDTIPEHFSDGKNLDVYSSAYHLLSAKHITMPEGGVYVASVQFLLLQFLAVAHFGETAEAKAAGARLYCDTMEMIAVATNEQLKGASADDILAHPLALSVDTIGQVNTSAAVVISTASIMRMVKDSPSREITDAMGLPPDPASVLTGLPDNYFPGEGKVRPPPYVYNHALFRRSGHAIRHSSE